MQVAFPFHVDGRRRSATTSEGEHVRELIEQVLFTAPGERVNRPDFGSGLQQMIFGPASTEMASTVQGVVQGALQHWLGDLVTFEVVEVTADDSRLEVKVQYSLVRNQERQVAVFERSIEE